jgi:predicted O-methyltransferase YrrM
LLRYFAELTEAKSILEVGIGAESVSGMTFAYSLANRLPATLISVDVDSSRPGELYRRKGAELGVTWKCVYGDSLSPEVHVSEKVDVLYIDGDHDFQHAFGDFRKFYDLVKEGGYVIIDDYGEFDGVVAAVRELKSSGYEFQYFPHHSPNGRVVHRKPSGFYGF